MQDPRQQRLDRIDGGNGANWLEEDLTKRNNSRRDYEREDKAY